MSVVADNVQRRRLSRPVGDPLSPAPAAITGLGLVTPLGGDVHQTWSALRAGEFINDHCRSTGEWEADAAPRSRAAAMALNAAREALRSAGWCGGGHAAASDMAIVVGTSKGSIQRWLTPLQHMAATEYVAGGLPDLRGLADVASTLAAELGFHAAAKLTVSSACASGMIALIRGAMLVQSGEARRVLVVATEASVHPLFLGSFARLGVLSKQGAGCRPFDAERDGFLMSEAAAAVCLEACSGKSTADPAADDRSAGGSAGGRVLIDRFALGADAAHLTASDPDGRVLRRLIDAVTAGRPVDLIHAHGTGTRANDPVELAAIESVMQRSGLAAPCLYSHKGALGHSLGAAGLVAVVLNALMHARGTVPGNVRTRRPMPARHVQLSSTPADRPIHRSVALAAGFGGATAAVSLICG